MACPWGSADDVPSFVVVPFVEPTVVGTFVVDIVAACGLHVADDSIVN